MTPHALTERVDRDRLADDLWTLVNLPSPTGNEREAALALAEMLGRAGARVQLDERLPRSPNVIARLEGARRGRRLQLAGHIDHINLPHPPPQRRPDAISGRGSADMKNGLAGMVEVVRLLSEGGRDFAGELLATAYGLHEAPEGDSRGLLNLIADGIKGDAAIVFEDASAGQTRAIVAGKGQSIWTITLQREGGACHELRRPPAADDLLDAFIAVASALAGEARRLAAQSPEHALLGRPSLFLGQAHLGDFYNRSADHCSLQGTRRWNPDERLEDVRQSLSELLAAVPLPASVEIKTDWTFVGEAYTQDLQEPIVRAFRSACQTVLGCDAVPSGGAAVTDANRLVAVGRVPTVLCGFGSHGAHADCEFAQLSEMERSCRLALQTAINYLESSENSDG